MKIILCKFFRLANVYATTDSDIKRIILRLIETPVQKMGMTSPQLLKLVDEFPKGAETLVTRVLHIVTDRSTQIYYKVHTLFQFFNKKNINFFAAPPSEELVNRVKELYQSRVSDVRFLIPVLSGLSKNEIFNALSPLIKLNPNVVKEVCGLFENIKFWLPSMILTTRFFSGFQ